MSNSTYPRRVRPSIVINGMAKDSQKVTCHFFSTWPFQITNLDVKRWKEARKAKLREKMKMWDGVIWTGPA